MATSKGHRIGEMLLDEEVITQEQLQECLQDQKVTGEKVGEVLVRKGYVTLEVLMAFLGTQMGVPYVSLAEMQNIQPALLKLMPETLMRTQHVIPLSKKGNTLTIVMSDPTNVFVTDDIKLSTRCDLELRLSSEKEIKAALDKQFGFKEEDTGELVKASVADDTFGAAPPTLSGKPASAPTPVASLAAAAAAAASAGDSGPEPMSSIPTASASGPGDTPVINFLTSVLAEASKVNATDIHFEPYEKTFRIRWRIDGMLQEVQSPPRSLANALSARLKTMAEMDTQAKGQAQQGRLRLKIPGREVTLSIFIAPTLWGEKVVMHILNADNVALDLEKLGMEPPQLEAYRRLLAQPYGLVLLSGPRQSGKSTTAYATLNALNQPNRNVSAVDEAADRSLPGINQVMVNEKRGVTYQSGVKAMLAQDSDVLLVGGLNDMELARMVLDAVPTGHLIITALHANDGVAAIQYLINMGLEPYLVGSSLSAVVNQRLVRVICSQCKESYEASAEIAKYLGAPAGRKVMLYRGKGCDHCSQTGYRGRQAVFEIIPVREGLRDLVFSKAAAAVMKKTIAETPGFIALRTLVAKKALAGVTSYEELLRVSA
jgi:type IV pilus assembly protein PilB